MIFIVQIYEAIHKIALREKVEGPTCSAALIQI